MATTTQIRPLTRAPLDAPAPLRLWHLTSLDAPTVAVTWTLAFAWGARIRLPLWVPVVIALSAWTIYIADRLLDARRAASPLRPRHLFHWRHRRIFLPIAIGAAIGALTLILHFMPIAARERNSVLAAAALLYFGSVHSPWRLAQPKLRVPKELLVGILFTAACAIPTWARVPAHQSELLAPILCFTALAWLNCHAIESWESASPSQRPISVFHLSMALAAAALLIAVAVLALNQSRIAAMLAVACLSAALLASLDRHRDRLTPTALRTAADLVLLTPLALLAVSR